MKIMLKKFLQSINSQKMKMVYGIFAILFIVGIANISTESMKVKAHTGTSCGTNDQENTDGRHCNWSPNNFQFSFYQDGSGYYWTDSMQLRWDQASADALKNTGHRYTQDNNDGGASGTAHFSATGNWGTTFPNPSFDTDDDYGNDCSYANEAEITSDNANFPTPSTNYLTTYQWQRSCLGTGQMYFTAQLSTWFLEWQTRHWDRLYTKNYSYSGAMSPTKDFLALFNDFVNYAVAHGIHSSPIVVDGGTYSYSIQKSVNSREINVDVKQKITSKKELETYKSFVVDEAGKLTNKGISKGEAVITFRSPQLVNSLNLFLNDTKLKVNSFEMRATDKAGVKITIGGMSQNDVFDPLKVFDEIKNTKAMMTFGAIELQGVTSLSGEINLSDYNKLSQNSSVYLIDVLPAVIANELPVPLKQDELLDVNLNDVYWFVEEYGE